MEFIKKIIENFLLFFQGALDFKSRSTNMIEDEIENTIEEFMILCYSDMLGIESPYSYYALEFLPFMAEEMELWQRNSNDRKSVWEQKAASLGIDP